MTRIVKMFNNNIALVEHDGENFIVMGKGIAFGKKSGDEIDESKIEQKFQEIKPEIHQQLSTLLATISPSVFELSEKIIQNASEELHVKMDESIHVSLADHLASTLDRVQKGLSIKNVLIHEIKRFYPSEFTAALHALDTIYLDSFIRLSEDEAGFIAMHFVNASQSGSRLEETVQITKLTEDIVHIVELTYGIHLETQSLNFTRFVTHIQYFAKRLFADDLAISSGEQDLLYAQVRKSYPKAYACAIRIKEYMQKMYHVELSNEEMVYFMLHIQRTTERNQTGM